MGDHYEILSKDGNQRTVNQGVRPSPTVFRESGLPGITIDNSIDTEPVSPEDVAPLLDAYAVVSRILDTEKSKIPDIPVPDRNEVDHFANPANPTLQEEATLHALIKDDHKKMAEKYLAKLLKIRFNKIKESTAEVSNTGQPITEFLSDKSPEQRAVLRQNIVKQLLASLIYNHTFLDVSARTAPQVLADSGHDLMGNLDELLPGSAMGDDSDLLSNLVHALTEVANFWDDLSDTDRNLLKNIVDNLGYQNYASYAGAHTPHGLVNDIADAGRHELVAEVMTLMSLGLDFPIWGPDGRRELTPQEVSALRRLFAWLSPKGTPVIRSGGITHV